MSDSTLEEIYNKINVEINNVNENENIINEELDKLYGQIIVDIVNVNENTNSINAELDRLYNKINVVIDDKSTQIPNESEDEAQNKINDTFERMLNEQGFNEKLIKYMYLTFIANDIYIEIDHNKINDIDTLSKIRNSEILEDNDLITTEQQKSFNHIKTYTKIAVDRLRN